MMKTNLPLHWHFKLPHRQEGAVLFVSLMFLIILTMLGISAIDSTKLETRMAKNTQAYNEAFQMAEVGLAEAGNQLIRTILAQAAATDETTDETTETIEVSIPDNSFLKLPSFYLDEEKVAELRIKMSKTKEQLSTKRENIFFVVQSKGYNGKLSEENAINVTLEGGMKREAPKFVGGMLTATDSTDL
jgi:type IV pilus assembly protein PilX